LVFYTFIWAFSFYSTKLYLQSGYESGSKMREISEMKWNGYYTWQNENGIMVLEWNSGEILQKNVLIFVNRTLHLIRAGQNISFCCYDWGFGFLKINIWALLFCAGYEHIFCPSDGLHVSCKEHIFYSQLIDKCPILARSFVKNFVLCTSIKSYWSRCSCMKTYIKW
jgi:hypothetical protein